MDAQPNSVHDCGICDEASNIDSTQAFQYTWE